MKWPLPLIAALVALSVGTASAAPPSALQAKRSQELEVEAQVNTLDVEFGKVVDEWDGARVALSAGKKQLAANAVELTRAKRQSRIANRRVARRLVALYETEPPDVVQLLVDAKNLSELIDVAQYSRDVAASDRRVAGAAQRAKSRLDAAHAQLRQSQRARSASLDALTTERARINSLLGTRRALLASVKSQVTVLRAREVAEQRRLAEVARARLAAQQAQQAQLRAQAEQARAAAAEAAVAAAKPVSTPTTTVASPSVTAPPPSTTTAETTTALVAPSAPPPAAGGHPAAASIALQYLGIRYQWGGATPAGGFDCSGLVMYVFAQLGVQLPHYAAAQYGFGTAVARDQLQPGDLVFFDGLSHVGIYIGNGQMVHAPQTGDVVKITPLSQFATSYVGARRI
jgi:peptidoglycan DL-endopeptidase CwlO